MTGLTFLAEDDPEMGAVVVSALQRERFEVRWFQDGRDTLAALQRQSPEYLLLDLGLPDMDGLDLLQAARGMFDGPILVLSARGFETQKVRALDLGADDYLVKPYGLGELLARLRVLRRRAQGHDAGHTLYRIGDLTVNLQGRTLHREGRPIHLTPIEFTLLATLVRAKGQLLTHRKLLQAVWGPDAADQTHYLRIYMGKLRSKIEPIPAEPSILLTETGVGYRICGLDDAVA